MRFSFFTSSRPDEVPASGTPPVCNPASIHKILFRLQSFFLVSRWTENNESVCRSQDDRCIPDEHAHRGPRLAHQVNSESFDTPGNTNEMIAVSTTAASLANIPNEAECTAPQQPPPIVITSACWTAEERTFTVRVEWEFTVYCTVVHPVRKWPAFRKFRLPHIRRKALRPYLQARTTSKGKGKAKGVKVERDMSNDMKQPASDPTNGQRSTTMNSGWSGVFSCVPHESSKNGPDFAIDRNSERLLVPEMNVGVAYVVKQEEGGTVNADESSPSDTYLDVDQDWLDFE